MVFLIDSRLYRPREMNKTLEKSIFNEYSRCTILPKKHEAYTNTVKLLLWLEDQSEGLYLKH